MHQSYVIHPLQYVHIALTKYDPTTEATVSQNDRIRAFSGILKIDRTFCDVWSFEKVINYRSFPASLFDVESTYHLTDFSHHRNGLPIGATKAMERTFGDAPP